MRTIIILTISFILGWLLAPVIAPLFKTNESTCEWCDPGIVGRRFNETYDLIDSHFKGQ